MVKLYYNPTASSLSLPNGWTASGSGNNLVFTSPSGRQIIFTSPGSVEMGSQVNGAWTTNGILAVYGTFLTGGEGVLMIPGNSPTPQQVSSGGTAVLNPNTGSFSATGAGTTTLAGFNIYSVPSTATVNWYDVDGYLNFPTVTSATIHIQVAYVDDQGNSQTDNIAVVNGAGNTASSVTVAGRYTFHWHGPNTAPATVNTNILFVNAVITGASAAVTGTWQAEIRKSG